MYESFIHSVKVGGTKQTRPPTRMMMKKKLYIQIQINPFFYSMVLDQLIFMNLFWSVWSVRTHANISFFIRLFCLAQRSGIEKDNTNLCSFLKEFLIKRSCSENDSLCMWKKSLVGLVMLTPPPLKIM